MPLWEAWKLPCESYYGDALGCPGWSCLCHVHVLCCSLKCTPFPGEGGSAPLTWASAHSPFSPTNPCAQFRPHFPFLGPGDPSCTTPTGCMGAGRVHPRAKGWVDSEGEAIAPACSSPCPFRDPLRAALAWKVSDYLTYLCPNPQWLHLRPCRTPRAGSLCTQDGAHLPGPSVRPDRKDGRIRTPGVWFPHLDLPASWRRGWGVLGGDDTQNWQHQGQQHAGIQTERAILGTRGRVTTTVLGN